MGYNCAQGPLETSTCAIRKAQKGFRGQGFLTFLVFVKNITKIKNYEDFCGQESQLIGWR